MQVMLLVDLRAVATGPFETKAEIAIDDPILEGLELALQEPLRVEGRLTSSGPSQYYWQGSLATRLASACRRCLEPMTVDVDASVSALFTEEEGADDASTYVIQRDGTELDLGPMVREELALAAPKYVTCRDSCKGLCAHCGKDLNQGPCSCEPEPDPRWAVLRALRTDGPDTER